MDVLRAHLLHRMQGCLRTNSANGWHLMQAHTSLAAFVFVLTFTAPSMAGPPSGFTETRITDSVFAPTAMEFSPDGRLFVSQQSGAVRIIKNGSLLATPFASFTVDNCDERGLLGIAFDPNFSTNH